MDYGHLHNVYYLSTATEICEITLLLDYMIMIDSIEPLEDKRWTELKTVVSYLIIFIVILKRVYSFLISHQMKAVTALQ